MSDRPVACITGARRGIGKGIVLELAKAGFDIAGCDVVFDQNDPESELNILKETVFEFGVDFLPVKCDITNFEDHDFLIKNITEKFGRLDIFVNNAGVAPLKRLDILETTSESYDRVMNINARGTFFISQKIANYMKEFKQNNPEANPAVIFISSISAYVSSPSRPEYCISKAAISMTASLFADRLAEYGINVYELRPGIIQTDMTSTVKEKYDKLIAGGLVPQKRWGFPEDIGRAVLSLARGDLAYSTGQVIEISGGMNIQSL